MKMLIDGEFIDKNEHYDVINPYDGELIDTIPIADKGDVARSCLLVQMKSPALLFLKRESLTRQLLQK